MNYSNRQSEITELTKEIEKFSILVDLYVNERSSIEMLLSEIKRFEDNNWKSENLFNQLYVYSVLAAAFGALKSKNLNYTQAYYNDEYVYKEIGYYHNVQYVVSRVRKEQWATLYNTAFRIYCRSFLCLANAYDHIGRFCEAQQYYTKAASDRNNLKDIEINRGYSYANIHSFWEHEEPWIIRRAQIFFNRYSSDFDKITPGVREMVCSWKAPSFEPPTADFQRIDNGDYEEWVNKHYLRLNRYCDVNVFSVLSLKDNVRIKHILDTEEMSSLLESMYDEIFNTFVQTRRKLYAVISAKEMLDTEEMKMIYKNFYSVLDKIAMLIKVYLDLPIEPHKVDFATIWVDKSRKHIQPKILAHTNNLSLLAIYNIKQDIYGSSFIDYVIDEQTKDLKRIRNFIEHKFVKISDGEMSYNDYQLTISKEDLSLSTIRLAQLVRCAIIYLCNFVMHAEYDKNILK